MSFNACVCEVCEPGHRVMVVGGGLTSAHVISIALQQGASQVTWVMRKHLQVQCVKLHADQPQRYRICFPPSLKLCRLFTVKTV